METITFKNGKKVYSFIGDTPLTGQDPREQESKLTINDSEENRDEINRLSRAFDCATHRNGVNKS